MSAITNYYDLRYDLDICVDIRVPAISYHGNQRSADSAFIAIRVNGSGCTTFMAKGVYFIIDFKMLEWRLTFDLGLFTVYWLIHLIIFLSIHL